MKWNNRLPQIERPEYPKLVALAGMADGGKHLIATLLGSDPDAGLIDGGERGLYARVHNQAAENIARQHEEDRSFPLHPSRQRTC